MTTRRTVLIAGVTVPLATSLEAAAQALSGAPPNAPVTGFPPGTPPPSFYTTKGEPVWEVLKANGERVYSMSPPGVGEVAAPPQPTVSAPPPPPPPPSALPPTQPAQPPTMTARAEPPLLGAPGASAPASPAVREQDTFSREEIVTAAAGFLGATAQAVAAAVERIFQDQGRPVGYVAGEEGSGAWVVGLRYGKGTMFLKSGPSRTVYWQGPSVGFDFGGNGSKVFTLIYGLVDPEGIYRRFPGVEGSAYFVGGVGVNYQRIDNVILAPMRAGVGLRGGAAIGYLAYSRKRNVLPF
jgi:hypothetical protein